MNRSPGCNILAFLAPGPEYSEQTRSIGWLLIPWLLALPAHQQSWYWLCKIHWFLSYMRKYFNYLPHDRKREYSFIFPKINSALQGLIDWVTTVCQFTAGLIRCSLWTVEFYPWVWGFQYETCLDGHSTFTSTRGVIKCYCYNFTGSQPTARRSL